MDINHLRAGITVFTMAVFLGIMVWAWNRQRRVAFDEAARLPFQDNDNAETPGERQ